MYCSVLFRFLYVGEYDYRIKPMMDKNTISLQMVAPTRKRGVDNAKNVECLTVALANFAETRRNLEVLANLRKAA